MNNADVVAAVILAVSLLAFLFVIVGGLTAGKRKRERAALAAQRGAVDARLRRRQQRNASAQGPVSARTQASPHSAVQRASGPGATAPPEPATSAAVTAPRLSPHPRIVTRTGARSGTHLEDPFARYGERPFSRAEDAELIRLYQSGLQIACIAVAMQLDTKQIASRLIRLLFSATGRLDTDDDAPRARRKYENREIERMRQAYSAGVSLERIAGELERSQLGVGWRMLDLHIPIVPVELQRRLQLAT